MADGARAVALPSRGTPVEPWKPTTALVVRGIYKRTRNPMYQAFGLFVLGLAFAFAPTGCSCCCRSAR